MEASELLKKARIQIQSKNSFFAYLSLYLKFKENKNLPDYAGAGVDIAGNFYYKKEFVEGLKPKEIIGLIIHELCHLFLLHLLRMGKRDDKIWNISADITVNQLIKDNNFSLPDGCIISDSNNVVDIGGIKVEDCNKKTAEQIYSELEKHSKELKQLLGEDGSGNGLRFDEHIKGKRNGKFLNAEENNVFEKMWSDRTLEALTISKMKGDTPLGVNRLVGELHKEKINWKALLNQYITQQILYDFSYSFPSKKSISTGVYMPHIIKDKINIAVAIDVSGSIGRKELTDFLSEICGIARAYQERIDMRLITHECDVVDDYKIENGSISKIMKLEIHGGGGTSHISLFDYIQKKITDCKCVLFFTDGYSDIDKINFNKYFFDKVFVISKDGNDSQIKGKRCSKIKLDELKK